MRVDWLGRHVRLEYQVRDRLTSGQEELFVIQLKLKFIAKLCLLFMQVRYQFGLVLQWFNDKLDNILAAMQLHDLGGRN